MRRSRGTRQDGVHPQDRRRRRRRRRRRVARVLEFGGVYLPARRVRRTRSTTTRRRSALRGLASVTRHRGDEERSSRYDDLVAAEQRSRRPSVGIQNRDKEKTFDHVNEIRRLACAKRVNFCRFCNARQVPRRRGVRRQRPPRENSHPEGERRRLFLARRGSMRRDPEAIRRAARGGGDARARALKCMQRDVEIEVDPSTRRVAFLGRMWVVERGGRRVDVGVEPDLRGTRIHPPHVRPAAPRAAVEFATRRRLRSALARGCGRTGPQRLRRRRRRRRKRRRDATPPPSGRETMPPPARARRSRSPSRRWGRRRDVFRAALRRRGCRREAPR